MERDPERHAETQTNRASETSAEEYTHRYMER